LALERHGYQLGAFSRILDWGCGPGKVIQALYWDHLRAHGEDRKPNLFGTDLSPSSVRWAARHIPFAEFSVNSPDPPLPFEAASFDFIYGISVFSHLDRQMEARGLPNSIGSSVRAG
jgi:SAM-dependent methyltransferase